MSDVEGEEPVQNQEQVEEEEAPEPKIILKVEQIAEGLS
jgi:hypothetical protein